MKRTHIVALLCFGSVGCRENPSLNLSGSYYPAWLLCIAVGILVTAVIRSLAIRAKIDHQLAPGIVVYPALTVLLTSVFWLLFCGVR